MYGVAAILHILNFQQLLIQDVVALFDGSGYYIPLGYTFSHLYYSFFMLYFKISVAYLLYVLFVAYRNTDIREIKQQYLFFGV
jgi:hypothetical protein